MAASVQGKNACDVLVIGGGAGLAAAIETATARARVILVEKNPRPGGTTALSVGSITATRTPHQLRQGIQDSPAEHAEYLAKINARRGLPDNPARHRVLTENVTDTFRWLLDLGVEFIGPLPEPPHRHSRMHCVLPTAKSYVARLVEGAESLGVEIRCGFAAQSLLTEAGRVVGVAGTDAQGRPARILAGAENITLVKNGISEVYALPQQATRRLLQRISAKYGVRIEYFYHPEMCCRGNRTPAQTETPPMSRRR